MPHFWSNRTFLHTSCECTAPGQGLLLRVEEGWDLQEKKTPCKMCISARVDSSPHCLFCMLPLCTEDLSSGVIRQSKKQTKKRSLRERDKTGCGGIWTLPSPASVCWRCQCKPRFSDSDFGTSNQRSELSNSRRHGKAGKNGNTRIIQLQQVNEIA